MALMKKARLLESAKFQKPDISQFIPPEAKDAVDRVVAAGTKLMYSPDMRQELQAEIERDVPPAQKMAEAVTGLILTLDKQSKGGIPVQALFPAAMELMGEAAEVLAAAGQPVTQEDYNEAARQMFVLIGRKLGASDEQLMQGAEQIAGQAGGEQELGEGAQHESGETPAVEQRETAAEGAGLPEDDELEGRA